MSKSKKQQTTQSSIKKIREKSLDLRTESIKLPKGETKHLTSKCNVSRIIYNSANYHFRDRYHITGKGPNRKLGWSWLKDQIDFPLWKKSIGAKTCDQILFVLISAYQGYFEAIKEWKKDPTKFLDKPQIPGYINREIGGNRLFILPLAGESLRVDHETGIIRTPKFFGLEVQSFLSRGKDIRYARIVPKINKCFVFEIIYRVKNVPISKKNSRIATIDPGVKNMVTLSTNFGSVPFNISGGPVLSINQYYHKEKARLDDIYAKTNATSFRKRDELTEKRNNKLSVFIHRSSRSVINYCVDHQVDTIVIGKNNGWKQNVKLGRTKKVQKRNNQNFVSLPHGKLIDQIIYKAAELGIQVILTDESYTSKCSFLDNEFPEHHSSYLGKRVSRGRFRANDGTY